MKHVIRYFPTIGIALFALLLFVASITYPGGSSAYPTASGFDWVHNYWCDLLRENAKNGMPNTARVYAFTAIISVCLAMAVFWYQFPTYFKTGKWNFWLIRGCGTAAMLLTIFIFTPWHDLVIDVATLLGLVALIGVFVVLLQQRQWLHLATGAIYLLLMALTNFIYRTGYWEPALPLVLKIATFAFLAWVAIINTVVKLTIDN